VIGDTDIALEFCYLPSSADLVAKEHRNFIPALPFYHVRLTAPTPDSRYPKARVTLGDHLLARRLDLGLFQKDVAATLEANTSTVTNWEKGWSEPELCFLPGIVAFLGYDPRPEGTDFATCLRRARTARGLSIQALAALAHIHPTTICKWEDGRHRPMKTLRVRVEEIVGILND